ncbi:MAG: MFS transporter [Pseudomonadota bacterium]
MSGTEAEGRSGAGFAPARSRLVPLIVSAAILLAGNGLLVTLISVRARAEGFGDGYIGLLGTVYYLGFLGGVLLTPMLIRRAGHIRVFAALAATSATTILVMVLWIDPLAWALARVAGGFAFCGCLVVIESWLNEAADNTDRGRVLSVYRVVDLSANTLGQFLLPVIGIAGFQIFVVAGIFFCVALIPVSLSSQSSPKPPGSDRADFGLVWAVSPAAAATCVTLGLTNGAFRTVGPVYAQEIGLGIEDLALFISLFIIGGAVLQYPLGQLSDRFDRRRVIIAVTIAAALAGFLLAQAEDRVMVLAGAFLFGGFALPLYSLASAHANDFAKPGQSVDLAAGLFLFFTAGAVLGPVIASQIMAWFGPSAFFLYTSLLHLSLVAFVVIRMLSRAPVPRDERKRAVWLLRTSPLFNRLVASGREERGGPEQADKDRD